MKSRVNPPQSIIHVQCMIIYPTTTTIYILLYRAKAVELIFEKNKSWIDLSGRRACIFGSITTYNI